jgi:hypothetical protein
VCAIASRPPGAALRLVGHGLRERLILGLTALGDQPVEEIVRVRRYRCGDCGAVCEVGPQGVVPRHRYTWPTICLALAMWGQLGRPARAVRDDLSPFQIVGASVSGWPSLRRWVRRYGVGEGGPRDRASAFAAQLLTASPLSAVDHGIQARIFAASLQPR